MQESHVEGDLKDGDRRKSVKKKKKKTIFKDFVLEWTECGIYSLSDNMFLPCSVLIILTCLITLPGYCRC